MTSAETLHAALTEVLDPEYPVSLVDMGLIRDVSVSGRSATVKVVFCSLGCPCTELIRDDIEARLLAFPTIDEVEIEEVYESWSLEDVSPTGRGQLRQVGVA